MSITANIDTSRLERVMKDSVRIGGRSAKSAVMATSIFFAQSGRKLTPIMRKNKKRDLRYIASSARQSKDSSGRLRSQPDRGFLIVLRHQNRPDTFVHTFDKDDKRRRAPNRGAAKNSWAGVLRTLNRNATAFSSGVGIKLGSSRKKLNEFNPTVTITNELSYLFKIAPRVDQQAIDKAANRMESIMDRKIKRELERAWI